MIAVDDTLMDDIVRIFIKKEPITYNQTISKLFKYIQPPIVIGSFEIKDKRALAQSQGIVRFIKSQDEIELAQKTRLKLILSTTKSNFPYININSDEFEVNYTATYLQNNNKQKVLEHIKALVKDSDVIEIYDRYLLFDNGRNNNHIDNRHYSVNIINQISSNLTTQELKIFCYSKSKNQEETKRISDRRNSINYSNIKYFHKKLHYHDRYIKIINNNLKYEYEIILSSGLYNILGSSDFTYVIRIK